MVRIRPSSRMTTPFPVRSVPSIDAVNASSGTSARSATTALSAAERSKSTSPARGWSSRGNAHSSFAVIEMAAVYGSDDNGYQLNLAQPSALPLAQARYNRPKSFEGARERSWHRGADDVPLRFHGEQLATLRGRLIALVLLGGFALSGHHACGRVARGIAEDALFKAVRIGGR